ncbi:TetR family transcriptional regulator [Streptacidiphilus melanogenes]|uniref:TetR family transcriptional regulator n=1 Tax=Streptacidiphilus melanogenes TaxID=411235 RepID=UPI000A0055C7
MGRHGPGQCRILEASLAAFAARGYYGASTRDIAAAAGVSPRPSTPTTAPRRRSLRDSLAGCRSALATVERARLAEESTTVTRMRALVHDYSAWHARHHQLAGVVQYELGALSPDHRDEIVRLRRRTEQVVRDEVAAGVSSGAFHRRRGDHDRSGASHAEWPDARTGYGPARPTNRTPGPVTSWSGRGSCIADRVGPAPARADAWYSQADGETDGAASGEATSGPHARARKVLSPHLDAQGRIASAEARVTDCCASDRASTFTFRACCFPHLATTEDGLSGSRPALVGPGASLTQHTHNSGTRKPLGPLRRNGTVGPPQVPDLQ